MDAARTERFNRTEMKMPRVILYTLFLLGPIVIKAQSLPEWYRVYTFDESTIEMNTSLVTPISSDVSRVRFRWQFDEDRVLSGSPGLKYRSQLEVMEFNCSAKQYRSYHTTFLDAGGDIVRIDDSPGDWRRLSPGSMMEKLFIPGCELIETKTRGPKPVVSNQQEKLERAARYASEFSRYVEHTTDFKPAIVKFFVADYLSRYLQDEHNKWFFNLSRDTAAKLNRSELERFYLAMMNAGYLSSIYLISQLPPDSEQPAVEGLLPADVRRLVRNHPYTARYQTRSGNYDFLGEQIESVQQLRSYTDLLEKISLLMRKHVRTARALHSKQYKAMLEDWDLYEPKMQVCGDDCLGLPKGSEVFEVNVPVFHLQLAKVGSNLKIISATCSF